MKEKNDNTHEILTPIYAYAIGIVITGIVAFIHAFCVLIKIKESANDKISYLMNREGQIY